MGGPKILLVISNATLRPAFSSLFKGLGCQVFTTITAENALAALEGFQPNVILVDMSIQDMKSSDFLKKLKEHPKFKDTPLVSYTKLLTYKLTSPELFSKDLSESGTDDFNRALEVLSEHIALVPGEIILWIEDALAKQKIQSPPILRVASRILRKSN